MVLTEEDEVIFSVCASLYATAVGRVWIKWGKGVNLDKFFFIFFICFQKVTLAVSKVRHLPHLPTLRYDHVCYMTVQLLKQPKPNRKCWIRSWIRRRNIMVAHHALLNEFKEENPKSYRNFLWMDESSFKELLDLFTPIIKRNNNLMRDFIPPFSAWFFHVHLFWYWCCYMTYTFNSHWLISKVTQYLS
jgi:hypothetical protein